MNDIDGHTGEKDLHPIARDTSDFADLRRSGFIYVDKMSYFHRLIGGHGPKCVFLSRPRRFGKSRMISTFEEIFKGRRDLAKMVVGHAVEQLA
ncbi:MAG: AAA family ATPase [Kiritimatiellae bacterium]|nr:AAA family ATPase [Kiritimatiellia bacterium]